ncbi:biliverdin-producing heme oxygenase [Methylosinus sp. RM1]|uniref:biliverdin-producing heme oxygenase n=1 Tax=Methylosinus sp. RM1 TaxID=2583817 RepID=UPI00140A3D38|nr:biliverdin-producing heme oxygenase [Methylosinus sp. RM1]
MRLLARLYGFHLPFERALFEAALCFGVDARIGARAHLLARDLVDLGADDETIAALPMARRLAPRGHGEWLGALYVREGSTLGAARLAAALDPLLGAGILRGAGGRRRARPAAGDGRRRARDIRGDRALARRSEFDAELADRRARRSGELVALAS